MSPRRGLGALLLLSALTSALAGVGISRARIKIVLSLLLLLLLLLIVAYIIVSTITSVIIDTIISSTPSPPTKSLDFRGFDSSKLLILKGGNSHVRIIS